MTINTWLCRHFDMEKKGYVTIANIITSDSFLFFSFLFMFVMGLYAVAYTEIPETKLEVSLKNMVIVVLLGWYQITLKIIIPVLIVITILYLFYKLSQIKIAKCELKEDTK